MWKPLRPGWCPVAGRSLTPLYLGVRIHLSRGRGIFHAQVSSSDSLGTCKAMSLLYLERGGKRETWNLPEEPFVIGRLSGCDLKLDDTELSRQHCQIEFHEGTYSIRDLGSRNGTLVNGEPVVVQALSPGDVIQIGDTSLHFAEPTEGEREPPGPPATPTANSDDAAPRPSAAPPPQRAGTAEDPKFVLHCIVGERAGEEFPIGGDGLTIGRRRTHSVVLSEKSVSSDHALVCVEAGQPRVFDWESRNGVIVNRELVAGSRTLSDGDIIQVEDSRFQLTLRGQPPPPASRKAPAGLGEGNPTAAGEENPQVTTEAPRNRDAAVAIPFAEDLSGGRENAITPQILSRVEAESRETPETRRPPSSERETPTPADRGPRDRHQSPDTRGSGQGGRRPPTARPSTPVRLRAAARRRARFRRRLARFLAIAGPLAIIVVSSYVHSELQRADGPEQGRPRSPSLLDRHPGSDENQGRDSAGQLYLDSYKDFTRAKGLLEGLRLQPDEQRAGEALKVIESSILNYQKLLKQTLPGSAFRSSEKQLLDAIRLRDEILKLRASH